MSAVDDRYDRQQRLAEVGAPGQRRLARWHAVVRGRQAALIEAQYLCRAGIGSLEIVPAVAPFPFRHQEWFRTDAARDVGAAAWRALGEIRRALELETP